MMPDWILYRNQFNNCSSGRKFFLKMNLGVRSLNENLDHYQKIRHRFNQFVKVLLQIHPQFPSFLNLKLKLCKAIFFRFYSFSVFSLKDILKKNP